MLITDHSLAIQYIAGVSAVSEALAILTLKLVVVTLQTMGVIIPYAASFVSLYKPTTTLGADLKAFGNVIVDSVMAFAAQDMPEVDPLCTSKFVKSDKSCSHTFEVGFHIR